MSKDEFVKYLKQKRDKFDIIQRYLLCFVSIGIGIFMIYDWEREFNTTIVGIIALFITVGLYGFWRIPATYVTSEYPTNKNFDEVKNVIETYLKDMRSFSHYPQNVLWLQQEELTPAFRYKRRFLGMLYEIVFHLNENDNILYVHVNSVATRPGIYDVGVSNREHKKLQKYLQENL